MSELPKLKSFKLKQIVTTGVKGAGLGALKACLRSDFSYSGYTVAKQFRQKNTINRSLISVVGKDEEKSLFAAEIKNIDISDVTLFIESIDLYTNKNWHKLLTYCHTHKFYIENINGIIKFNRDHPLLVLQNGVASYVYYKYGKAAYEKIHDQGGLILNVTGEYESLTYQRVARQIVQNI